MSEKTLARRVDDILRVPAFEKTVMMDELAMLICPRCNREVTVDYNEFRKWNRDRVLIVCLYCHAFSRRPGMTKLKVRAILKRKAKKE